MPIYAYRCEDCGHAQDFLQKMSDPLIAVCPACASVNFKKQLTSAGFQLKGGGWYVTDFRDNGKKDAKKSGDGAETGSDAKSDAKGSTDSKAESKGGEAPSTASPTTPAPAAAPAAGPTTGTPSTGGSTKAA